MAEIIKINNTKSVIIDGFKKTKIGYIPNDWSLVNFEDISIIDANSLKSSTKPEYEFKYISLSDVDEGRLNENLPSYKFANAPSRARRIVKKGSILMSTVRPNLKSFCFIKDEADKLIASTGFAVIDLNQGVNNEFLYQFLFSEFLEKQIYALVVGSNYPAINSSEVKKLKVPLPSFPEQQKIASILSDWDEAIEKTQTLIKKLELRKKGLMQKIFSAELRLNGKNLTQDWKEQKLNYYLDLSNDKNIDNHYNKTEVLSVSGEHGIINQIKLQGRSFAGKSVANYGIVRHGDVVYTKSPLKANPYGIIKVNKGVVGIVSTLYAIYKCKPSLHGEFIDYYFQLDDNLNSYLRPLVQKGTKNDMKINNQKVLSGKVKFPPIEEQLHIVDFFKKIDNEIQLAKKSLLTLQSQKKGLMQQLLTGKIRVKI